MKFMRAEVDLDLDLFYNNLNLDVVLGYRSRSRFKSSLPK